MPPAVRSATTKLGFVVFLLVAALLHATAQAQQLKAYTLQPGDQLDITVWKEPDLTKQIIVRPDGKFSFPLAGEITASGRTVAQVQAEIEGRLKKYIPEPVISVSLLNVGGNRVYVIGQVKAPGSFVMNPQLNVLQALSMAGGMTPFASVNDIKIIRGTDGKQSVLPFRYEDVSRGRNLEQNILLESGDVVVVP
ncbi:MAG: polysaccharide biosynthesis/export family protein [Pseudomonadota bacterium]|jgi:Periplasmic protein involved in polysaccharide export|nr:MAG: sugar transporter [Pseudomonadota bacterium]